MKTNNIKQTKRSFVGQWKFLFALWLAASLYVVVLRKLSFGMIFWDIESIEMFINLIPFDFLSHLIRNCAMTSQVELSEIWFFLRDFILNIALFIPAGICLTSMGLKIRRTFAVTFAVVLFFELSELVLRLFNIGTGIFDVNDIIAAFIGMFLGVGIYTVIHKVIIKCNKTA